MHSPNQFDLNFVTHSCEQVLRFSQVEHWNDLSEERKVQLGFNIGVVALALNLTKEESFQALTHAREGQISMHELREHLRSLITAHHINKKKKKIARPF